MLKKADKFTWTQGVVGKKGERGKMEKNPAELPRSLLIVSLRPDPYARMKAGTKRHEFRRRFTDQPAEAYLYIPVPVGAIAAYAEFGRPFRGTPEELAAIAEQGEPGSYAETLEYLDGVEYGFAVPVLSVQPIEPLALHEMREAFSFAPPRSSRRLEAGSALEHELAGRLAAARKGSIPGNRMQREEEQ